MFCGIDVGGTSVKAGLVNRNGTIAAQDSIRVECNHPDFPRYLAKIMAELVNDLLERSHLSYADIPYVGVGMPGSVDDASGTFLFAPNMPIHEAPIRDYLAFRCNSCPVRTCFTINCSALIPSPAHSAA